MSPEKKSRQDILDQALVVVKKAAKDRGVVAVRVEARRLFTEHPDCPMSLTQIEDEITRLAVTRGVAVEFGEGR